jgi:MerR family transcriptional regulator, light-induced transcriptional regulator
MVVLSSSFTDSAPAASQDDGGGPGGAAYHPDVTQAGPDASRRAPGTLTIGELADRTGLTPAVLRTWEARHGFPSPQRSAGGHRWYREADVALVRRVLQRQRSGVRLDAAVREVTASAGMPALSVFAMLGDVDLALAPQLLHKTTVLGLSRAIEDDYLASAEPGLLCGAFQRETFYRASARRWSELARRSHWCAALADFAEARDHEPGRPALVPLSAEAPMRREWAVIAETPRLAICLAGWEPPGQEDAPDPRRVFEVRWTVDPAETRRALRICLEVAADAGLAGAPEQLDRLGERPLPEPADPRAVAALVNRAVGYADRAHFDRS